ncbi:putative Ig domain-containing protein [Roseibacillus persicicus]|uniref:putative Ig domain-containing protein n=1 Tax=Roseibacillus persicicus TaxID=454148 RepID=UPI002810342B|nr:putative Ig domain-containing protein [Roseibacillus persicicus]MDQ8189471.1 CARDB domain-containing protein [Roseibacillus persicicus]
MKTYRPILFSLLAPVLFLTNALALDSDSDGFSDAYEDSVGTDKNDASDKPLLFAENLAFAYTSVGHDIVASNPTPSVYRLGFEESERGRNVYASSPPTTVHINGSGPNVTTGMATHFASPPVVIDRCEGTFESDLAPFAANSLTGADWRLDVVASQNAVRIDGRDGTGSTESWLIGSPTSVPAGENLTLNFDYFHRQSDVDNGLTVLVGNSYSSGDPNAVSWTDITPSNLTSLSKNTWHSIPGLTISGVDGSNVRVAFRYTSSGNTATTARFVALDNICLVENIFLPPAINSFTANGVELSGGETFRSDVALAVSADNFSRIGSAEFAYRRAGAADFTVLGQDTRTANGLAATWPISQVPDGNYELTARLYNGANFTEQTYNVTVALDLPMPPVITSPTGTNTTENLTQTVRVQAADGTLVKLYQNGSLLGSGRPANGSTLTFTADLPLGESTFTATASNRAGVSAPSAPAVVTRERRTPVLGISLAASTLIENEDLAGTVTLQSSLPDDLIVTLSSTRPNEVDAGPPVTIPAGSTSTPFLIKGIEDKRIEAPLSFQIEASAPRATPRRTSGTLLDNDIPVLALTSSQTAASEGAGEGAFNLVLTRDIGTDQLKVALSNSDITALTLPAEATFAAGQNRVTIPVATVDDAEIDGTQTAEVRASLILSSGQVAAQSNPLQLTVTDDEGPALRLAFDKSYLLEGESDLLTVTRLGGDQTMPLEVTLTSSDASELTVDTLVTIPANLSSTIANLQSPIDEEALDSIPVTITATATDHSLAQLPILVVDQTLPDLVINNLNSEVELRSNENFQISYQVENQGRADTPVSFTQSFYLSKDTLLDPEDTLLRESPSPGILAEGAYFDRTLTLRAPTETGTFYLLAVTDSSGAVNEISEDNNFVIYDLSVVISPAYTATVAATLDAFPVGTPIQLTGSAGRPNSQPAAFVPVNIHVRTQGTERIISAITNAVGNFATTFIPLPGEGGDYQVGAVHPGVSQAPTQDTFSILTFENDFANTSILLNEGSSTNFFGKLSNPTSFALTDITLEAIDLPDGLTLNVTLPDTTLPGGQSFDLTFEVGAAPDFAGGGIINIQATSEQGVSVTIPIEIEVLRLYPELTVNPESLTCSVLRGSQKLTSFLVENTGGSETGPIDVILPSFSWISRLSSQAIPSLQPGESTRVSLLLQPGSTQALTQTTGNLVLRPTQGDDRQIPFAFRVVSDLTGDLEVEVVDEYFFYTEDAPKVADALVIIRDPITAEEIARATTPESGLVVFAGLPEAFYQVEVSSPNHSLERRNLLVNAGTTTPAQIFISRNLVTYTWTVQEVEIEDRYEITVETEFEVNVPAPVVTASPAKLELEGLDALGQTRVINITLENHGLIGTSSGAFSWDEHPFYKIEPLISEVGVLPAKSKLVVPVVVTRIGVFDSNGEIVTLGNKSNGLKSKNSKELKSSAEVPCALNGNYNYGYFCAENDVEKNIPIPASNVQGNCPVLNGHSVTNTHPDLDGDPKPSRGFGTAVDEPYRRTVPVAQTVTFATPTTCDCPFFSQLCVNGSKKAEVGALASLIASQLGKVLPSYIKVDSVKVNLSGGGRLCVCCEDGEYGLKGKGTGSATVTVDLVAGLSGSGEPTINSPEWTEVSASIEALAGAKTTITGSVKVDFDKPFCLNEGVVCATGSLKLEGFAGVDIKGEASAKLKGPGGDLIDYSGEAVGKLGINGTASVTASGCSNGGFKLTACGSLEPEATLKFTLKNGDGDEKVVGGSLELPKYSVGCGGKASGLSGKKTGKGAKVEDVNIPDPIVDIYPMNDFIKSDAQVLFENYQELFNNNGVCAKVKISLSQNAVMTRSAFRANLELANKQESKSLTGIAFDLDIRDLAGTPADEHFNIRVDRLTGLGDIGGSGSIGPNQSGSVQWSLIPRDTAAPTAESIYTVGGQIRYLQDGVEFTIPVDNVQITVRPDAQLYLKYFHQRDVFSDDPFTPEVEPSIPYKLAVLVENRGAGSARNLSITSAQPEIVENDKGALIDFEVISTQVAGQNQTPDLSANFGEVAPGASEVAIWSLTSSLQGLFIDYKASFEHLDSFNDPRLSLLKEVEIFEMNHLVQALGDKDDGLPDFLTNDIEDFNDFPDTIHFSDGGSEDVNLYQQVTYITSNPLPGGGFEATIGAELSTSGWSYLRILDPGEGDYFLTAAERCEDGLDLLAGTNVWLTDRTFEGLGKRPRRENILHLLDCNTSGTPYTYKVTFQPKPDSDLEQPTSSVASLAASSPLAFPVTWRGQDTSSGIASYDLFVSADEGPWELWLNDTKRTSAIFEGSDGVSYRFYSIATDLAGNVESKTAATEASTVATLANAAPIITPISDQTVVEGSAFRYQAQATDPDGLDNLLRFALSGQPAGMSINPQSGLITWLTSSSDAGRVVNINLTATDAATPSATSSIALRVSVAGLNEAPQIEDIAPLQVSVGESAGVAVKATDPDFPLQTLTYSLGAGAPAGMSIDAATGLISWVPEASDSGQSYQPEVVVTDNGSPNSQSSTTFLVTVSETPLGPPTFETLPVYLWLSNSSHSLTLRASDPDGTPVTLNAVTSGLPGLANFTATAGSGEGTFQWTLSGVPSGIYTVPLTAKTPGETTSATLTIRVDQVSPFSEWAANNLSGLTDPGDYGMFGNPDGDDANNLHEFIFLRDPLVADFTPVEFSKLNEVDPFWNVYLLEFLRHPDASEFVTIVPEFSPDMINWDEVPAWQYQPLVDPKGDHDDDAGTQQIILQLLAPAESESGLYRLNSIPLPEYQHP